MSIYDISSAAYYSAAQKIFGMRPSVGLAVIDYYEGVQNLFSLSQSELKSLSRLVPECRKISPELVESSLKELDFLKADNIRFISHNDSGYPTMLKEINNYPIGIYIQTKDSVESHLNRLGLLGVIGGKSISDYGKNSCDMVIDAISSERPGAGIITRLSSGVDSTANIIAKNRGIPSIGVIPYGFSKSPNPRRYYKSPITITDIPPGETVCRSTILRRDRIVSALSRALILIESNVFGSCDQIIDTSLSYGKEIWAFPGPVNMESYSYNNKLIRLNLAEIISSKGDLKEKIKRI
ncbi:MAG: DNA-protecting protein DprA [Bacteroidales bacterium]|nr:DNA-protecting protein DprA [Bacteroidales bacterium]